jgi:hypothetical protein
VSTIPVHPVIARSLAHTLVELPPSTGWRVLRTEGRVEARWSSPDGSWAAFSARAPAGATAAGLVLLFSCSDRRARTVAAARQLLAALPDRSLREV